MGCGKTTLGKDLALKINYRFIDLDYLIEDQTQKSIYDIFIKGGEDEFRKIENEILIKTLQYDNSVVATGGGTPCYYGNIDWMNKNGQSIYLKVSPDILNKRLLDTQHTRPLIHKFDNKQLEQYISTQLPKRDPFYNQAQYVVQGDNIKVKDILGVLKWGA